MHCFHCILVEPYKKRKKPKTIAYLLEGFSIKSTQTQSCNCWCCLCWRVDKNHFDLPSRLHFPNQGTILRSGRRKDKKKAMALLRHFKTEQSTARFVSHPCGTVFFIYLPLLSLIAHFVPMGTFPPHVQSHFSFRCFQLQFKGLLDSPWGGGCNLAI